MEIKYHYIQNMVQKRVVNIQYVVIDKQIVDVLIESLLKIKFEYFKDTLGVALKDFPRKRE
jgi:hypothetical protein